MPNCLYLSSHADQVILTNTNFPTEVINSTSISNPYAVPFNEIHANVNTYAIAYSGHSAPVATSDLSFFISVISTLSTQLYLALTISGSTTFAQIQFCLIVIGNQGIGFIEATTVSTYVGSQHKHATFHRHQQETQIVHPKARPSV